MLTDPALRSKIDALWDKLWSGGLSNPMDAIEQLSFLLFLKRLDEREEDNDRVRRKGKKISPLFPDPTLRWSHWTQLPAAEALKQVREKVFPFIKALGGDGGSFAQQMENAEFKINKPSLLIEACKAIDELQISSRNQDVQGDLYEYLLSRLNTSGTNGQFRTPRHIIRMMVTMADPKAGERICDPAAGTCGFLVNAFQHILEANTSPGVLKYDEEGYPHGLIGDKLTPKEHDFLQSKALTGFDNDSGMTMLRIGSMNMMLHGVDRPNFRYSDTLSKAFTEEKAYELILANPPFKGAIDQSDINSSLPTKCKKTEILFMHLFLRLLDSGGRAAVIVPDGLLFGSSNAHVEIRKKLVEESRLDGVVSMPSGVFRPYAGVSTAVLIFTKGATTKKIWYYDMENDGYSLDDKRQKIAENDIPDILDCWSKRNDSKSALKREERLNSLRKHIAPLKSQYLEHQEAIHRLRFEEVIASESGAETARTACEKAVGKMSTILNEIRPLQDEINQLSRQFWVSKDVVKANNYDLSASRYRRTESEDLFLEKPSTTLARLRQLDDVARNDLQELENHLRKH